MSAITRKLEEELPNLLDAYKDLGAAVPSSLQSHVKEVSDFSEQVSLELIELKSINDFRRWERNLKSSKTLEVVQSVLVIDRFTRRECNIGIAD